MKRDFAFSVTPAYIIPDSIRDQVQFLHFQSGFRLEPVLDPIQYRNDGGATQSFTPNQTGGRSQRRR